MENHSTKIALGGMFSALCITLMFMTGIIPFATYAIPMLSGAMLIPVMIELGDGVAMTVYVSVCLVSVFVVADKEAAIIFIVFFGYYPVLKRRLDKLRPGLLRYIVKLCVFNLSVAGSFVILLHVFGMLELASEVGLLGRYTLPAMLALGNLLFAVYDAVLTRYYILYVHWFKPRFLRR